KRRTEVYPIGPLSLYLAGRAQEALAWGDHSAELARTSRDAEFRMYSLSHFALVLTGVGRYGEAARVFDEAREFGGKYGVVPLLARATALSAGLYLNVFDFERAEALQREAREMAASVNFTPPVVSAGIDMLLTFARQHDPGRGETLLRET